jgi:hypothetical protein
VNGFHLKVRVRLFLGESYCRSGWRGICAIDGVVAPDGETIFGCELTLEDADRLTDEKEVTAMLRFWVPISYAPGVKPGLNFELRDGGRPRARGVILAVQDGDSSAQA